LGHLLAARVRGVIERPTDTAAFDKFWQMHRPRIWRMVARLAGSVDIADDLTQEVSLRAFSGFSTFRGGAAGFTWLYRIAVNVVLRHREHLRLSLLPLDHAEAVALPAASHLGPEAAALRGELQAQVWAALDQLPEDTRATLILQVYEQLKYREIAEVLNIPLGTVKSRLHTGMALLREELKDEL
jgi:RNA polymerase sigma-70 factor (ECF subfamily)